MDRPQNSGRWRKEFSHVPHLLIQGTEDLHIQAEKVVSVVRQIFSRIEIEVLEGVGHAAAWEAPEKVDECLLAFVRRYSAHEGKDNLDHVFSPEGVVARL